MLLGPGGKDLDVDVLRVGLVREHWDGISGSSPQEVEVAGSSTAPARHVHLLVSVVIAASRCLATQALPHHACASGMVAWPI